MKNNYFLFVILGLLLVGCSEGNDKAIIQKEIVENVEIEPTVTIKATEEPKEFQVPFKIIKIDSTTVTLTDIAFDPKPKGIRYDVSLNISTSFHSNRDTGNTRKWN
ncbi:hypothetical protein I6N90_22025 [Paenibacillus sp. GSMTC-2017]|uniref:hypothetical protein n=1 Tax=Paenibacillus sp. GSMTC-2017 TaxID=2794350 RepID=UPI0018D65906|nr:hypothetical protein [Paenibacillus sp. GSMTC-2017]MBH5320477.1 hypothetical protein [Paenibacillus sp. GSMTC-2017]